MAANKPVKVQERSLSGVCDIRLRYPGMKKYVQLPILMKTRRSCLPLVPLLTCNPDMLSGQWGEGGYGESTGKTLAPQYFLSATRKFKESASIRLELKRIWQSLEF